MIYGMGEKPITELCKRMKTLADAVGQPHESAPAESLPVPHDILQTAYITRKGEPMRPSDDTQEKPDIVLHSHETCLKDKKRNKPKTSASLKRKAINTKPPASCKM